MAKKRRNNRRKNNRRVVNKTTSKATSKTPTKKANNTSTNGARRTKPKIATKTQNEAKNTSKTASLVHKSNTNQNKPNNGGIISKLIAVFIKDHKDNNGGHPHVIVDNVDDKHVSVGLTTQKKKGKGTNAGTNYSLQNNPLNPKSEPTYMRRQAIIDNKNNYSKPRTGKMDEKDYEKAKEYGEKAKQKYLDKKNENKKE